MPKNPLRYTLKEVIEKLQKRISEEDDYFDIIYKKSKELLNELELLYHYTPYHVVNDYISIYAYLTDGKVKDWVEHFKKYDRCVKRNRRIGWADYYIYEMDPEDFLEYSTEGLVVQLKQGNFEQKDRMKLIPLLQKIYVPFDYWPRDGFDTVPYAHAYIAQALGFIGSKKSVKYLKILIEWYDRLQDIGSLHQYGEHYYDYSYTVRREAVKSLLKISREKAIEYLKERFFIDVSHSVRMMIYHKINEINPEEAKSILDKIEEERWIIDIDIDYISIFDRSYLED